MIDNSISNFFPPAVRTVGYVILIAGILLILANPIIGIAITLIGTFVSFAKKGVQIDIGSKRFRDYTGLFGLAYGRWESLEGFTDISVLRKRISTTAYSRSNRSASTSSGIYYDVCLLDKTHRTKRIINRLTNEEESIKNAKELSAILEVDYAAYNPQISAATKARRR